LLQRLVFPPIAIDEPDQGYAQYLWGDDASFSSAQSYLIGRSAQEICQWRRLWINRQFENDEDGITLVDFLKEQVTSTSLAHNKTMQIPDVHWEDIGGLSHVRAEIMDAIELPLQHPELFAGVTRRTGVLLYGPPGTGKTLVAKAVATECGLPFFSVKGPELLGSYVGESEANVRQIFRNAREAAKKAGSAILFFDELDSLAPRRGGVGDGGGVMERVVATLLAELDRERTVFLIGATNRPDLLDPSMLRPGRLDRRVYLGLPTEKKDRAQVLAALIRKFRLELPNPIEISLQVVEKFPRGLSGADFSAIANGALMLSLKRLCDVAESHVTPDQPLDGILDKWDDLTPLVTARDLIEAAAEVVPSVTEDELRRYQHLQEEFSSKLSVPATPIRVTAVGSCVSEITPPPQIRHLSAVTSPAMRHLSILGLSSAKNVQDRTDNKV
jgi:peroxin-6